MNSDGTGFQILHTFRQGQDEGFQPTSVVVDGSTIYGGVVAFGSVYRVNADGSGFQVLRDFGLGGAETLFAPRIGIIWCGTR